MSQANMKSAEHKRERYLAQNKGRPLTIAQRRRLRITEAREAHQGSHVELREKQRARRTRFREWMRGVR